MGVYRVGGWYFNDETDQNIGPFRSEEEAKEAEKLYGIWLNNTGNTPMTPEQMKRFKDLMTDKA